MASVASAKTADGAARTRRRAKTWVVPVAFVAIGGLMVTRSALVDVRPFRAGLDAMRQLAFAGQGTTKSILTPEQEAGLLVLMTAFFILVARFALRSLEERARREGRLTMRWR